MYKIGLRCSSLNHRAPKQKTNSMSPSISKYKFNATYLVYLGLFIYLNGLTIANGANVAINNRSFLVDEWTVRDLPNTLKYKPNFEFGHLTVPHEDVSHWPVSTYYWQAPDPYYHWKIYTYGGDVKFLINHVVTRGDTSGKFIDEADLVLEGGPIGRHIRIGYKLPRTEELTLGWDTNQTIQMPLKEDSWYYLENQVNEDDPNKTDLKMSQTPVTREDFSLVLAGLNRSLIRAKYHMDQVEGSLFNVTMTLANNRSRTVQCDNDCAGALLDDLDAIELMFDEILRLAPHLKDGPQRRLAWLTGRANNLTESLNKYLHLIAAARELVDNYTFNFDQETLADILMLKASDLDTRAPVVATEAHQAYLLAKKTLEELLRDLWNKIRATIKALNEHGFGPSGLSTTRIERLLQESELILRELRGRNFKGPLDDAERELRKSKSLLARISGLLIDPAKSAELLRRLAQLTKTLMDFARIVQEQVQQPVQKANELVQGARKQYQLVLDLLKESEARAAAGARNLDEAYRLIELTKKCLQEESVYLDQLPRLLSDLNNGTHELEVKRSNLARLNPPYQREYVDKCKRHGNELVAKAKELDGLFNATRDVADYALRAANVYKKIAASIAEAERAAQRAHDAADKAYKVAVPDYDQSLADQARESKRKSQELLERALKLHDQDLRPLSLELAKKKQLIDSLFEQMKATAAMLDAINAGLRQLAGKNLQDKLAEIDAFLKNLLDRIGGLHRRLDGLGALIAGTLLPQFERLNAGTNASLGNLSQVIDSARNDILAAIKSAGNSNLTIEKILKMEAKLDIDLDALRRKIQLAHQEASGIHVSVMPASDNQQCVRSYFVPTLLSSTHPASVSLGGQFQVRSFSLLYSVHGEETDSLLVYMSSKSGDDFIAIEMFERRIRCVYSLQGYAPSGIQTLQSSTPIETNDQQLLIDELWYRITLTLGENNEIRLSVRPVTAKPSNAQTVLQPLHPSHSAVTSGMPSSPFGEANVQLFVGGLPPPPSGDNGESIAPKQIRSSRLNGCLYELILNDAPVGLWNFKTNVGCEGCMEGAREREQDTAIFSFTGAQSYALQPQIKRYDLTRYMVSMSVRTSEPNALLFLSISTRHQHYVSLQMRRGRIVFVAGMLPSTGLSPYLGLSSSSSLLLASAYSSSSTSAAAVNNSAIESILTTNKEYNLGKWIKITAEKDGQQVALSVDDEFKETQAPDKLLALNMDQIFIGGVWPLLQPKLLVNTSLEFTSLNGCMKDVQIETTPVDLLHHQSYGVDVGCQLDSSSATTSWGSRGRPMPPAVSHVPYPLPAGK